MGFAPFDHTADLGIALSGASCTELFREAAAAFAALVVGVGDAPEPAAATSETRVALTGDSTEELLVRWLEELLFEWDAHGRAPLAVPTLDVTGDALSATVRWAVLPPDHEPRHTVKAVTYHGLTVTRAADGSHAARVVLDV